MVNHKLSTVAYTLNPKRIVQSDGDLAIFDFLYTYLQWSMVSTDV